MEPYSGKTNPPPPAGVSVPVSYVQLLLFRNYCSDSQGNKDWATLCIHKSHGEIIGEVKVVNEPIVGVVQA